MSEERDLQAKIAALSGRINLHKQATKNPSQNQTHGQGYGRGATNWVPQRGTPYGYSRGRGGAKPAPPVHRNRKLILNNSPPAPTATPGNMSEQEDGTMSSGTGNKAPAFVTKQGRHMQLINNSIYDKFSQERAKAMQESFEQRKLQRNERELARLGKHFQLTSAPYQPGHTATEAPSHVINVGDLRFRVADGGSKLIRLTGTSLYPDDEAVSHFTDDATVGAKTTPRQTKIGGVTFVRSKHGNLYRAGLGQEHHKIRTTLSKVYVNWYFLFLTALLDTISGTCPEGPHCRFVHDPNKVAICKDYLAKGACLAGDACDLSHDPTPNRVPACLHFLRGNCTNDSCRYAHIRVNPGAPVCRGFATLGYCEKGAECADKHVFECPDYANKGLCRNNKCRLPHVDRAGQIRKRTAQSSATSSPEAESSDLSSDEDFDEIGSDDVDSDGFQEDMWMQDANNDGGQELTQQRDFVAFGS
ncbi:hypothetical protein H2199_002672 [Coniosporium tulheliwenetii]|uniref:Uncharacterized protein n=1 Tax=Coniosporium tulheliwenetii TaxID=3383036 RepID=A0ACC2ZG69_9PEZI|nr:hypothetical protein H2199_002672 [Cladosporium sp. JES 115]